MPWYVTITLFLLSPLYAIVVRDKFWPRVQDWWASRSRRQIQNQLDKLEVFRRVVTTPAHVAIYLLRSTLLAIMGLALGLAAGLDIPYFLTNSLEETRSVLNEAILHYFSIGCFAVTYVACFLAANRAAKSWQYESEEWQRNRQSNIERRIQQLRDKLKS